VHKVTDDRALYTTADRLHHLAHLQEKRSKGSSKDVGLGGEEAPASYHHADDLGKFFAVVAAECSEIAQVFTIGQSSQGRPLQGVRITDNPTVHEEGEPEFKYVGNMHGDETVGRYVLVQLIRYLCNHYADEADVRELVDSVDLYIVPTMNPDGFELATRENGNRVDLNRNFPDQYDRSFRMRDMFVDPPPIDELLDHREVEVQAMMKWSASRHFVASANLHGGSIVANYPWDGSSDHRSGYVDPTPDNDSFRALAKAYANGNPDMKASREFKDGITNGVQWYSLYGGMQDWNYLWTGDQEITLELSYRKFPAARDLPGYWKANKKALFNLMEMVRGPSIRGRVLDQADKPVAGKVFVKVSDGSEDPPALHWVPVDVDTGDFYKLVVPGKYTVEVATSQGIVQVDNEVVVMNGRPTDIGIVRV